MPQYNFPAMINVFVPPEITDPLTYAITEAREFAHVTERSGGALVALISEVPNSIEKD